MTYFDNAATTYPKPKRVLRAFLTAMRRYGANPGRGGHKMSLETSEKIYEVRETAVAFFGLDRPENIIFTKNCTEALNFVIKGLARRGGHFVCSSFEHNAAARPLETLKQCGICDYSVAEAMKSDEETEASFERLLRPETVAIVCTGASNVFGKVMPTARLAALAHRYGLPFVLDAAQTAGLLPVDCACGGIDFLCCAGHKGLYGPMGTGILAVNSPLRLRTLIEGGTGSFSTVLMQPENYPERLESGTLNVPGILALGEGIRFVQELGVKAVYEREMAHIRRIYGVLSELPGVELYTDPYSPDERFVPLLSFNLGNLHSERTALLLAERGVAVRAGLHCAPLAHKGCGTLRRGTVRLAPSVFTNRRDVNLLLNSIIKIAKANGM